MENNIVNILLELDPEKLARKSRKEIEIKRLSGVIGAPFMVTVAAISGDRYSELAGNMVDEDGEVDYSLAHEMNLLLALEGIVQPDMKDKELMKHFGCATPKDLMDKFFNGGEIATIADAVTELSGYGKEKVKKVKNSSARIGM